MDKQQRHKVLQSIMWDYSVSVSDMDELLEGKINQAGHYTIDKFFAKMLIGLPWHSIIQVLPVERVKEMLTDEIIKALWPKSVQNQYKYVRQRLQETLPDTR